MTKTSAVRSVSSPHLAALAALGDEPLDGQQISSIYSVISYVARGLSLGHELLQARVEAEFSVPDVEQLRRRDYPRAVDFLLDLHMGELKSRR